MVDVAILEKCQQSTDGFGMWGRLHNPFLKRAIPWYSLPLDFFFLVFQMQCTCKAVVFSKSRKINNYFPPRHPWQWGISSWRAFSLFMRVRGSFNFPNDAVMIMCFFMMLLLLLAWRGRNIDPRCLPACQCCKPNPYSCYNFVKEGFPWAIHKSHLLFSQASSQHQKTISFTNIDQRVTQNSPTITRRPCDTCPINLVIYCNQREPSKPPS